MLPSIFLSIPTWIHHILCKVNFFLLLFPLLFLYKPQKKKKKLKKDPISKNKENIMYVHRSACIKGLFFAYQKRYKNVELALRIEEFDQRGIGKMGETFEGEVQGEQLCRTQPWLWQVLHRVDSLLKTWLQERTKPD